MAPAVSFIKVIIGLLLLCLLVTASEEETATPDTISETVQETESPTSDEIAQKTLDDAVEAAADLSESDTLTVEEELVVTLTDGNFNDYIQGHERTMVEFYAPWCGHCKALAPEYEEAARILKEMNSPTTLAKLDATENPGASDKFQIQGYPTLILFENGIPTKYEGGRQTQDIVKFIRARDVPPYDIITHEDFENMKSDDIDLEANPEREYEIFAFVRKGSKRGLMNFLIHDLNLNSTSIHPQCT